MTRMDGPADDLAALAAPPARPVFRLGGAEHAAAPLTLARYAAARRFGRAFAAALGAPDPVEAAAEQAEALAAEFCAATGIDPAVFAAADAAEQMAAFFALVAAARDFTTGPLAAAVAGGLASLTPAAAAPDGPRPSPGSVPADMP